MLIWWALSGWSKYLTLRHPAAFPIIPVSLHVPHPSQRNTHAKYEARNRLDNAFRIAKRACQDGPRNDQAGSEPGVGWRPLSGYRK